MQVGVGVINRIEVPLQPEVGQSGSHERQLGQSRGAVRTELCLKRIDCFSQSTIERICDFKSSFTSTPSLSHLPLTHLVTHFSVGIQHAYISVCQNCVSKIRNELETAHFYQKVFWFAKLDGK
jgi:hypothetical protein